ncbi:MAG: hypothetical protein HYZ73_03290, partial [Elusimicrobia bacterium]|nr:hypothetical protein [Elusimicrobiota bacterium]
MSWLRWPAAGMVVVFFYSNVLAPPLAQAGFWEERRQAVHTRTGQAPPLGRSANGTSPLPAEASQLLASLPSPVTQLPFGSVAAPVATGAPSLPHVPSERLHLALTDGHLPGWLTALASSHGTLREVYLPSASPTELVVHLQDAHEHEEAQRNLAVLVETF